MTPKADQKTDDAAERARKAHLLNAAAAQPALVAAEHFADAMAQIAAESGRFAAQRAHAALQAQQEMLGCSTFEELRQAQADYVQAMTSDYAAEWLRVTGLFLKAGAGRDVPPAEPPRTERHATPV